MNFSKNYTNILFLFTFLVSTTAHSQTVPFNCDYYAYLFQFNDVYSVDLASGSSSIVATDITPGNINAAGYNSKDGYIWGSLSSPSQSIVKIGKDFATTTYTFSELPTSNRYIGDISLDGIYYLKGGGTGYSMIDLDPASSNYLSFIGSGTLSQNITVHDWAFNAVDNMLYTVEKNSNILYRINITTNNVESVGEVPILSGNSYTYGAVYFDLAGNFYVSANQTGTVYIINNVASLDNGDVMSSNIFAFGPSSSSNDGARCPTAPVPVEDCSNGIDDDGDGLVDCDDPSCSGVSACPTIEAPTSGGNEGGLESNNRLSTQINRRNYNRMISNYSFNKYSARRLIKNNTYGNKSANSSFTLENFIPLSVINEDFVIDSSPMDLINITNATDLLAVDYQVNDQSIASILALKTEDGVYEHTKYICDRLLGAELLSVSTIQIRDYHFIKSIIKNVDGGIEFVLSLSAREVGDSFIVESHWNLDKYTAGGTYYNFQIWANSLDNLLTLGNEVINLLEVQKVIESYTLSAPPPVFVKKGSYKNGELNLHIINSNNSDDISFNAGFKETETSSILSMSSTINLNENYITNLNLTTGNLFDIGFRIGNGIQTPDDLFMSDGPWGFDDNATTTQVLEYEVNTNETTPEIDQFIIERNPYIKAQTQEYVSLYKAFTPRFTPVDVSGYNTLEFDAKGTGTMEVRFIKNSIDSWENQYKTEIELTDELFTYQIPLVNFVSSNESNMILEDVVTIVFTLKSLDGSIETKEVLIEELKLSNLNVLTINDLNINNLSVYPNPVKNVVNINFNSNKSHLGELVIYNQLGQEIRKSNISINSGNNTITFKCNGIEPGLYLLSIKSDYLDFKAVKLIVK